MEETLLAELMAINTGSGIQNPDGFTISQVARDEYFAYTLGLSADAGIADAAQLAPMRMTTAFSLSVVKLEEGADAEAVCADFAANVDWQKWVCVMPTNALVAVKDNMVLCLVAAGELYAMTASGIESTGWTVVETLVNELYSLGAAAFCGSSFLQIMLHFEFAEIQHNPQIRSAAAFGGAPHQSGPGSEEPGTDSFSPGGEALSFIQRCSFCRNWYEFPPKASPLREKLSKIGSSEPIFD